MTNPSSSRGTRSSPVWPTNAEPYYRPALFAAIAASVGIIVGSFTPWLSFLMFTINGLDVENWGTATLILGALSGLALLTAMFWERTPFDSRWAVPVAWGIVVSGVACLTDAVINTVRIMTIPKGNIFGVPIGVSAGWGLWLVAFSSAVMSVTAGVVATQITKSVDLLRPLGESGSSRPERWRRAAIITSALIVIVGIAHALTHPWKHESGGGMSSPTMLPSFPSFPPFSSSPSLPNLSTTPSSTSSQASTTPAGSAGASVVVGGETLYVGDYAVCQGIPMQKPTAIEITIGHIDPKGASAKVTMGDTPHVLNVFLFGVDGVTFMYDPAVPNFGPAGGPVYAVKNGDSYTLTGTVVSDRLVSKHFEMSVTCH